MLGDTKLHGKGRDQNDDRFVARDYAKGCGDPTSRWYKARIAIRSVAKQDGTRTKIMVVAFPGYAPRVFNRVPAQKLYELLRADDVGLSTDVNIKVCVCVCCVYELSVCVVCVVCMS